MNAVNRPIPAMGRICATIRREAPLVFFVCPFIVGQSIAYEFHALFEQRGFSAVFFGVILLLSCYIGMRRFPSFPSLVGALTMSVALCAPQTRLIEGKPQLMTLMAEPRFPSPGALEGIFRVDSRTGQPGRSLARCRAVALPWRNLVGISVGQSVEAQASFHPITLPLNPLAFDATQRRHGVQYSCKIALATPAFGESVGVMSNFRQFVKSKIVDRFGEGEIPGLFLSMVLGVRDTISPKTSHAFQATGLSHLLVVSGFHITLIFTSILFLLRLGARRLLTRQPDVLVPCLMVACIIALSFVAFVGIDGASLRAGIAAVIVVIGKLVERGTGLLSSIALAFFVISFIWPGCYFEPGVQLTFAALLGIAYGLGIKTRWRWVRALAVAVFPSLMTLGLSILWFGIVSPASFVLNPLLAAPVSFIVTVGGLSALLAMFIGIDPTGRVLQWLLEALEYFRAFVWWCSEIPYAAIEVEGGIKILLGVLALLAALALWIERALRVAIGFGIVSVGRRGS